MAFELSSKQPDLAEDIRRIALEQIDGALVDLAATDKAVPERIHSIRKRTKKLRGLIRLVRRNFPDFKAENVVLRDAARLVSGLRDSEVMLATLDQLVQGRAEFAACRARLDELRHAAYADASMADRLDGFRAAMAGLRQRAGDWRIKGDGFGVIEDGVRDTWRMSHHTMKRSQKRPSVEAIHEWRKRVKDYWYQTRILRPIWPEVFDPQIAAAAQLEQMLGTYHDIDVLLDWLQATPDMQADLAGLVGMARQRQGELSAQSCVLGQRLFAGSSRDAAGRWEAWWQIWRDGRNSAGKPH